MTGSVTYCIRKSTEENIVCMFCPHYTGRRVSHDGAQESQSWVSLALMTAPVISEVQLLAITECHCNAGAAGSGSGAERCWSVSLVRPTVLAGSDAVFLSSCLSVLISSASAGVAATSRDL